MGARIGYSWLNGVVMGAACLLGLFGVVGQLVPIEAGIAIVLYIGLVIAAQAFQATPPRHAPAVALGLLPGLAGWGALMLKAGLRAGGSGRPPTPLDQPCWRPWPRPMGGPPGPSPLSKARSSRRCCWRRPAQPSQPCRPGLV